MEYIEAKLDEIYNFWFKTNDKCDEYYDFWFDKSVDNIIKEKYENFLINEFTDDYTIKLFETETDIKRMISVIILYDQFTRNLYRGTEKMYINDDIACACVCHIFDTGIDKKILENYGLAPYLFMLIVLRHQKQSTLIYYVLNKLNELERNYINNTLFYKFKLATLKNIETLTDDIINISNNDLIYNINDYNDIIDEKCYTELKVYNTTYIENIVKSFIIKNDIKKLSISLSGGVDSMVLLNICNKLYKSGIIEYINAIHINYNNRDIISKREEEFLIKYCGSIGVPLLLKNIIHIKRDTLDRNFYEEHTKNIRFNVYKYSAKNYGTEGVILGHHADDYSENILTNIIKSRDILDLGVMKEMSIINDIKILRPLIIIPKSYIYEYSENYKIPYFKDTTPDWSIRGIMRRQVFPLIKDKLNDNINKTLYNLGKQAEEYSEIIQNYVIKPITNRIKEYKYGLMLEIGEDNKLPNNIWSNIIRVMSYKLKLSSITNKNFDEVYKVISNKKSQQIELSNGGLLIIDNNIIYYFNNIFKNKMNDLRNGIGIEFIEVNNEKKQMGLNNIIDGYIIYSRDTRKKLIKNMILRVYSNGTDKLFKIKF